MDKNEDTRAEQKWGKRIKKKDEIKIKVEEDEREIEEQEFVSMLLLFCFLAVLLPPGKNLMVAHPCRQESHASATAADLKC